ncbi:hypothetical protein [Isorropodon fossajaponicum symbiont]|uniref:RraA family protein n=1 Tax=Isorropodon fossajaponicum symbiont TaxID=883811 RepID=UPI00247B0A8E|nr:hypothetical protein [Isorropodon fossajaponicum symbiont]
MVLLGIRDAEVISSMPIGIRVLGTHPFKSVKKNVGEGSFSDVDFIPGAYLYADQDGIIVIKEDIESFAI